MPNKQAATQKVFCLFFLLSYIRKGSHKHLYNCIDCMYNGSRRVIKLPSYVYVFNSRRNAFHMLVSGRQQDKMYLYLLTTKNTVF